MATYNKNLCANLSYIFKLLKSVTEARQCVLRNFLERSEHTCIRYVQAAELLHQTYIYADSWRCQFWNFSSFLSHIKQCSNSFSYVLFYAKFAILCNQCDVNFTEGSRRFVGKVFKYGIPLSEQQFTEFIDRQCINHILNFAIISLYLQDEKKI